MHACPVDGRRALRCPASLAPQPPRPFREGPESSVPAGDFVAEARVFNPGLAAGRGLLAPPWMADTPPGTEVPGSGCEALRATFGSGGGAAGERCVWARSVHRREAPRPCLAPPREAPHPDLPPESGGRSVRGSRAPFPPIRGEGPGLGGFAREASGLGGSRGREGPGLGGFAGEASGLGGSRGREGPRLGGARGAQAGVTGP